MFCLLHHRVAQTGLAVLAGQASLVSTVKSTWMTVFRIHAGMVEHVRSVIQGLQNSMSSCSFSVCHCNHLLA